MIIKIKINNIEYTENLINLELFSIIRIKYLSLYFNIKKKISSYYTILKDTGFGDFEFYYNFSYYN
jgi:hypothetical protein